MSFCSHRAQSVYAVRTLAVFERVHFCGKSFTFAVKVSTIMAKRLLAILLLSTAAMLASQAQNADGRIGTCMNEGRWFDLAHELNVTPADSVNPILYKMAVAMTHHYFNRPDSACTVLGDLLNNHQEELGDNTLSMAVLMGMNLARTDRYAEAADLMQSLCGQLEAMGADSTQTAGLSIMARQYRVFAENGPVCRPLHPAGTYRVPMKIDNAMHTVRDKASEGHFIAMDGRINGRESTLVFDTGAGVNIISSRQAYESGLRLLDAVIPMAGIGMQQGHLAMADTLRIGDMVWANVPFLIVDIRTGNAEVDSTGVLLPPVIGLPLMLRMQEVQLDFEHRQFIIPAVPSSNPLGESNMLRTDSEVLHVAAADGDGRPLYLHFDTGGYGTTLLPHWYLQHKEEVMAAGIPDSLRVAGVGGVNSTRAYRLPYKEFRIGNGEAVLDSVTVDTGVGLHTGGEESPQYLGGEEDGTLGLDLLEQFRTVILNLEEMYLNGIPY